MGKFWLGAGLLALFLVLGLWVGAAMDTAHMGISQALTEAAELALDGQLEQGCRVAQQAQNQWDEKWHGSACVADGDPLYPYLRGSGRAHRTYRLQAASPVAAPYRADYRHRRQLPAAESGTADLWLSYAQLPCSHQHPCYPAG